MKKIIILMATIVVAVGCSANKEYGEQKVFVEQQFAAIDTVSSFEELLNFQENFLKQSAKFDSLTMLSQDESAQLQKLYDSLSAMMMSKTMKFFPTDSVSMIDEF